MYLGERPSGQQAAVKVIHAGYAHDPTFRTRFKREVQASRAVRGRYVAPVLDADTDGDPAWLATEYVPGPTLSAFVEAHGPLPEDQVLPLAAGLLEGLATIHQASIVHRDLKPSNVLLTEDAPVIIDFGVATAADATSLTATGLAVGSAGWMAPEQLRGMAAGAPADVFAWGAVVAFAATGRPPFGTGRPDALGYRVAHEPPDLTGVPPSLRSVIERALEKNPDHRPTLDDLRFRLTADRDATVATIAAGWEAPTEIATLATSASTPPGRRRKSWRSIAFVAAVLAILAASVGVYLLGTRDAPEDSPTQEVSATSSTSVSTTTTATTSPTTTEPPLVDPAAVDYANFTHTVTCAEGPKDFTLVNGEAAEGDIVVGDPFVELHEVFYMDVDGDGDTEALADITCSQGANLVTEQVLTYQAAPERPVRLGSTIFGFSPVAEDGSILTHEPVYGPDDPRCCPSGYRRDTYRWSTNERDFILADSQPIAESDLPSATGASIPAPGEPCDLGSDRDCVDPEGDGQGTYLVGGGDCMDTFAPDSTGLCSDLDGDGYAGYPDSG